MDLAVVAEQSGQSVRYSSLKYDPYQMIWTAGEINGSTAVQDGGLQPTLSGDYCLVGRDVYYRDERIYVNNARAGQFLAGSRAFVTYKTDTFNNARQLFLYRVLDQTVQELHALPVVSHLTTDSGFGTVDTTYTYDLNTAACDPAGTVAQFGKVRSSQGGGYTEVTYFNSLTPDGKGVVYPLTDAFTNVRDFFSMVGGQIYQSRSFDQDKRLMAATTSFLYAYDKDAKGDHLFGAYVRLRRKEDLVGVDLFELAAGLRQDLDQRTMSQSIRAAFAAKGVPLSDRSTVTVVTAGASWTLNDPKNGNPYFVSATPEALPVRGAIKSVVENEFNTKGQVARSISYNANAEGQQEKLIQTIKYAWEIDDYSELATLNCLSLVAATTSSNDTQKLTTAVEVVTFKQSWNGGAVTGWAPHKTYAWDGTGSPEFDFKAWSGSGTPPPNWVLQTELIALTAKGQPVVTADIDGVRSSILFDRLNRFTVASFGNADCLQGEAGYHGDEWETRWQGSAGWSLLDQQLVYSGTDPGTLTLKNSSDWKNYGVRLRLSANATVTQPIGLQVGNSVSVRWNAGNWEIYDIGLDRVVFSMAQPVMNATDWMLVACGHSVVFFADGRQVLQYLSPRPVGGALQLFTSNPIALQYLIVFNDPVVRVAYSDGSGNLLQSQALDDGAVIASATCYDSMGRAAITTKAARFDSALPGYRTEFVTGIDWTSGVLTGEVATAYSDDEGYSYWRQVFDNAPTSRVIEAGSPGKVLGIDLRTPVDQRHTTLSRLYTNGTVAPLTDLPPNEYSIEQTIDPDKLPSTTCRDKRGNIVAAWTGQPGGDATNFNLTRTHYDAYGNLVRIELPNYFQADIDNHGNFYTLQEFDFFGRVIRRELPESRPYAYGYVYDKAGRVRFMQDPNGAKTGYLLYWLYDSVGRVAEAGWCPTSGVWAAIHQQLQDHADDKTWLPSAGNWLKRYAYDGDGSDLDQIGQLVQAETADPSAAGTAGVTEQFEYDESGRIKTKTTQVKAFAGNQPFPGNLIRVIQFICRCNDGDFSPNFPVK